MTLFCRHKNLSFPMSKRVNGRSTNPYVVCLDCGKEFEYDWQAMKVAGPRGEKKPVQQSEITREIPLKVGE